MSVLRFLWSLPGTVIGLLIALAYLPRKFRVERGALFVDVRYCIPTWAWSQTYGCVIVARPPPMTERIKRHELEHVRQWGVWGPAFFLVYPLATLIAMSCGGNYYRDNAFEIKARAAERDQ